MLAKSAYRKRVRPGAQVSERQYLLSRLQGFRGVAQAFFTSREGLTSVFSLMGLAEGLHLEVNGYDSIEIARLHFYRRFGTTIDLPV